MHEVGRFKLTRQLSSFSEIERLNNDVSGLSLDAFVHNGKVCGTIFECSSVLRAPGTESNCN